MPSTPVVSATSTTAQLWSDFKSLGDDVIAVATSTDPTGAAASDAGQRIIAVAADAGHPVPASVVGAVQFLTPYVPFLISILQASLAKKSS